MDSVLHTGWAYRVCSRLYAGVFARFCSSRRFQIKRRPVKAALGSTLSVELFRVDGVRLVQGVMVRGSHLDAVFHLQAVRVFLGDTGSRIFRVFCWNGSKQLNGLAADLNIYVGIRQARVLL